MIHIQYPGRFGNNLTAYCFARILSEITEVGMVKYSQGMPFENQEYFPNAIYKSGRILQNPIMFRETDSNPDDLLDRALNILNRRQGIILNVYAQNWKYYMPYRDKIKEWLKIDEKKMDLNISNISIPNDAWVMHLRREDYLESGSQLSIRYYEKILKEYIPEGSPVYVIGKDIEPHIKKKFEDMGIDTSYLGKHGGIEDFVFMERFKNIVGSNSTFSFWAQFLSDAVKLFVPLPEVGYWSRFQAQRLQIPGFHTIIEDDNRYA